MSEKIRPQVQTFLDELRDNIAKLDAETKEIEAENRKRDALIQEKVRLYKKKEVELQLLKKNNEEGKAELDRLDGPLQEFIALEEYYKNMEAEEIRKLEEAKKRRRELEALKPVSSAEKILTYHDEINRRIAELTLASRNSQNANIADEHRQLSNKVHDLEEEVEQRKKRVQELKNEFNKSGVLTTTEEQRGAVLDLVSTTYEAMKTRYIGGRIELAQLQSQIDE